LKLSNLVTLWLKFDFNPLRRPNGDDNNDDDIDFQKKEEASGENIELA